MESYGNLSIYISVLGIRMNRPMQIDKLVTVIRHTTRSQAQEIINTHNKEARETIGGNCYRYEWQEYSYPMEPAPMHK